MNFSDSIKYSDFFTKQNAGNVGIQLDGANTPGTTLVFGYPVLLLGAGLTGIFRRPFDVDV
jgi:hypothetical protein